jgi:hypothetical protein
MLLSELQLQLLDLIAHGLFFTSRFRLLSVVTQQLVWQEKSLVMSMHHYWFSTTSVPSQIEVTAQGKAISSV